MLISAGLVPKAYGPERRVTMRRSSHLSSSRDSGRSSANILAVDGESFRSTGAGQSPALNSMAVFFGVAFAIGAVDKQVLGQLRRRRPRRTKADDEILEVQ